VTSCWPDATAFLPAFRPVSSPAKGGPPGNGKDDPGPGPLNEGSKGSRQWLSCHPPRSLAVPVGAGAALPLRGARVPLGVRVRVANCLDLHTALTWDFDQQLNGREKSLYVFKGARSAPDPGWPPILEAPRAGCADRCAAQLSPVARRGPFGGTLRAWAPPAALRPSGPRRRRRASHPRGPPRQLSAATISARRANCKSGPSSRRSSVKPGRDHPQGRFASHVMACGHPCD
jgi:hypothetical protein